MAPSKFVNHNGKCRRKGAGPVTILTVVAAAPMLAYGFTFLRPNQQLLVAPSRTALHLQQRISALSLTDREASPPYVVQQHRRDAWFPSFDLLRSKDVASRAITSVVAAVFLALASPAAWAENELSAKYGGGLDTSLVDQSCLVNSCSLQAKACLKDDPNCRKGLTCTAKCLGDNACITGCMARYGNSNLDNLLKCTIEDNDCIKIAILPGGADPYGQEPRSPAPTIPNFDVQSMQGTWFKVVGMNPNYDCYACQRNTFSPVSAGKNNGGSYITVANAKHQLSMDVEFSMPRLMPDGSPPLPTSAVRESIFLGPDSTLQGSQSMALNDYHTHELMVFDTSSANNGGMTAERFVLHKGQENEASYSRTAHSEGEMFGLKFWENWYIIGENDPDQAEFKFIYYNGKTRQNTYEGAFVYSRTKELPPDAMRKVYQIANDAGMNPDQFCRIRNGCFQDSMIVREPTTGLGAPTNPFRGILASTRVSELLGVEPVAARDTVRLDAPTAEILRPAPASMSIKALEQQPRAWWYEVGDYLENPHRHFEAMDRLRTTMDWPQEARQ